MAPAPYRRVAVIGAGPSGIAVARALQQEGNFECIRVYERKHSVGGLWLYDPSPESFEPTAASAEEKLPVPAGLSPGRSPCPAPRAPRKRPGMASAAYDTLDTNAGARTMAFTHTEFPTVNSAGSIRRLGAGNDTRPRAVVLQYLEEQAEPLRDLISCSTHVERVENQSMDKGAWVLTLRQENSLGDDLWHQVIFDAVVVASGHFNVGNVPRIDGLLSTWAAIPDAFEHSKSFRSPDNYVHKRVVVVGGGVSAAELVEYLHNVVTPPLYVSRRTDVDLLAGAWKIPHVEQKPIIRHIISDKNPGTGVTIAFSDGSVVSGINKVIFATGYRLSYPFLESCTITPENRLAGFYQHIFCIKDPSICMVGQVDAAISLRVFEYQAVAVARFLAGRASRPLPSRRDQEAWETSRLAARGNSQHFHEIRPDLAEYYDWLRRFAGPPCRESMAYDLPPFEADWAEDDLKVILAKGKYWESLCHDGFTKNN